MNTIEQAVRRLAQLRSAGVTAPLATGVQPSIPVLEIDGAPLVRRNDAELDPSGRLWEGDGRQQGFASPQVEIDLERLGTMGYVSPQAPSSRRAEEFRMVKRPLLTNARGNSAAPVMHANRVMVTSSQPGEGKTFVSINMALSIAMERDFTVLLIDADPTRPAVLERLGLPPSKGLLDLLSEPDLELRSVLLQTNVERLSILPAGTLKDHATELLASKEMSTLVDKLASRFPNRILLFDAPPLLGSTESRVLAAHMGQIVFVVAADSTPQSTVSDALLTLENCPVVMTLLNKADSSEAGSYYGSRSYSGSRRD
ncbi:MAG: XrtA-associated tyrosine autokinase [Burkholderiaceae bacterium]